MAGAKGVILPVDGGSVFVPAAPIAVGDPVIIIRNSGGITIMKAGGSSTPAVEPDPCTALSLMMVPGKTDQIRVSWTPGANNDAVHYEMDATAQPTKRGFSDRSRGVTVGTTTYDEDVIRYFATHYVSIWGMKGGKFSSTYLTASIKVLLSIIYHYLKMYVTANASDLPLTIPGFFVVNWDLVNDHDYDRGTFQFIWDGTGQVFFPTCWYLDWVKIIINDTPIGAYCQWHDLRPGWQELTQLPGDLTPYLHPGVNTIQIIVGGRPGGLLNGAPCYLSSSAQYGTGYDIQIYQYPAVPVSPDSHSWYIYGDSAAPVTGGSGVIVQTSQTGGFTGYDLTFRYYDGTSVNNWGYIAVRIADMDNGVLEVLAAVSGTWNPETLVYDDKGWDKELYFGGILLCGNIDRLPGSSYHGYLNVSELGI